MMKNKLLKTIYENCIIALVSPQDYPDGMDTLPHRDIKDMTAVIKCGVDMYTEDEVYLDISYSDLDELELDADEMFEEVLARNQKKYPFRFGRISDVCNLDEEMDIFYLTNDNMRYGSGVLMYDNMLDFVYQKLQENYYIIPANIHELLIVPESSEDIDITTVHNMIMTTNRNILNPGEALSEKLYYYDHDKDEFYISNLL